MPVSRERRRRWLPGRIEAVVYMALILLMTVALARNYVFVQHNDGVLALYSGGAPVSDSVFCVAPVALILLVVGTAAYLVLHGRRPRPDDTSDPTDGFFSQDDVG